MEIILLEKIHNLGSSWDEVTVKNGYARNYLIPQKKAVMATAESRAAAAEQHRLRAEQMSRELADIKMRAAQAVRAVTLSRLCGDKGQLYGAVSSNDIAKALSAAGAPITKAEINYPTTPIKQVGEYKMAVVLHPEVRFDINVTVVAEITAEAAEGDGSDADAMTDTNTDADAMTDTNANKTDSFVG